MTSYLRNLSQMNTRFHQNATFDEARHKNKAPNAFLLLGRIIHTGQTRPQETVHSVWDVFLPHRSTVTQVWGHYRPTGRMPSLPHNMPTCPHPPQLVGWGVRSIIVTKPTQEMFAWCSILRQLALTLVKHPERGPAPSSRRLSSDKGPRKERDWPLCWSNCSAGGCWAGIARPFSASLASCLPWWQ